VVQERLVHSQISETLGIHPNVLPSMQSDAADQSERMVLGDGR